MHRTPFLPPSLGEIHPRQAKICDCSSPESRICDCSSPESRHTLGVNMHSPFPSSASISTVCQMRGPYLQTRMSTRRRVYRDDAGAAIWEEFMSAVNVSDTTESEGEPANLQPDAVRDGADRRQRGLSSAAAAERAQQQLDASYRRAVDPEPRERAAPRRDDDAVDGAGLHPARRRVEHAARGRREERHHPRGGRRYRSSSPSSYSSSDDDVFFDDEHYRRRRRRSSSHKHNHHRGQPRGDFPGGAPPQLWRPRQLIPFGGERIRSVSLHFANEQETPALASAACLLWSVPCDAHYARHLRYA